MEIFRKEAISAQRVELHGDVFLTQPVSTRLITLVIFLIVALCSLTLIFGSYARSENVSGHVVASNGLVQVRTPQFSILEAILIEEGDTVIQGQQLASLKLDIETRSGSSSESNILDILNEQAAIIEQQILNQAKLRASRLLELGSEEIALATEANILTQQIELQTEILNSVKESFEDVQELRDKGIVSKLETEFRYQSWLEQEAQLRQLDQSLASANARMNRVNIRIAAVPNEYQETIANLQQQLNSLRTNKEEIKGRQSIVIYAPIDGVVTNLNVRALGINLLPQSLLLTILPGDSELEAELFVPSRAIGFVEKGQEIRLMYDAFPYQYFGSYPATVESITQTILNVTDTNTRFPIREPSYRITAVIADTDIQFRDRHIRLQPGMLLRANIILERRSLLEWLLEPLNTVRQRV